jgi:Galactose mutarotase and related enzymes
MESFLLENAHLRMRVAPQGGALLSLFSLRHQLPVLREASGEQPGECALFPMLPLANRVAGNRFAFAGRDVALPQHQADEHFFLHGDGWLKRWEAISVTRDACTLQLRSKMSCGYDYLATLCYRLTEGALDVTLTLTHQGAKPMLYGCGFHPWFYFDRQCRVQFYASGCWPEGESHLPRDWQANLPDGADFSCMQYGRDEWLNLGYSGWNGCAVIENGVMNITLLAQTPWLMLFRMPGSSFLCLEPQTHPVNAHNMAGQPGLQVLGAGDSLHFSMQIRVL